VEIVPAWANFPIRDHAEYLGFQLGPGGVDKQWDKAVAKCRATAIRWRNIGAGFMFNTLAANVYMIPLFSYIGQLAKVSDDVTDTRHSSSQINTFSRPWQLAA